MRWTDCRLVTPGAHDIQGQGPPDSLSPVLRVSGVFPGALPTHGGQTKSPTRVRKPSSKKKCLWDCAISFCLQLGATPCLSSTPLLRAWTCSYVSNYRGEDKLLWRKTSLSLAVAAVFQPLVSEKGAPCLPATHSLPNRT